jgi:MATE family multidrug resistance protein
VALPLAGTDPETTAAVYDYLLGRAPTILPFLWFTALRGYLQAVERAGAGLWAALVANLINIPMDGLLALGDGALEAVGLPSIGLPGQGVYGLGLASTLVTFVQVFVLWVVFKRMPLVPGAIKATWSGAKAIMKIGAPIGLHFSAEVGIFGLVSVVAGGMGPVVGGAHQVALQLASFTFMFCLGISQATTVRVGRAVGAREPRQMQVAGLVGMGSGSVVMVASAIVLSVWPEVFARVMTDDAEVQAAAIPLLRIAGVFQIFDGLQSVSAGALRGASDTRVAFLLALVGYWAVGLPVALGLAKGLGWGAPGLWWGLTSGLMVAGTALSVRFVLLARRGVRWPPPDADSGLGAPLPPQPVDPVVHGVS